MYLLQRVFLVNFCFVSSPATLDFPAFFCLTFKLFTSSVFLSFIYKLSCSLIAKSYMLPKQQMYVTKTQEMGYGNRSPQLYIQTLGQDPTQQQPHVQDKVRAANLQKPQGSSLKKWNHVQTPSQPGLSFQSRYEQRPGFVTERTGVTPLPQQQKNPSFTLNIPYNFSVPNKEPSSTSKGPGFNSGGTTGTVPYSLTYSPSSDQTYGAFSGTYGLCCSLIKGPSKNPVGGKASHESALPSFQLSLPAPIHPLALSPKHCSSSDGYPANPQVQGSENMASTKPQSSSPQIGLGWILSSTPPAHQQMLHRTYDSVQSSVPRPLLSHGHVPTGQSFTYLDPSGSHYIFVQPYISHHDYNQALIDPSGQDYERIQSPIMASSYPTKVASERNSRLYNGQLKPGGNSNDQHQTKKPATPVPFASETYYERFSPSPYQKVETAPPLSPVHPISQTVAQLGRPADLSSHYQYSRSYGKPDTHRLSVLSPSVNMQDRPSTAQRQHPPQSSDRRQQKPVYAKLLVDVDDGPDGNGQ